MVGVGGGGGGVEGFIPLFLRKLIRAVACDFQQCGILTSVDSETQTSLCRLLLILETPRNVQVVA